jgi:hypothetical protein
LGAKKDIVGGNPEDSILPLQLFRITISRGSAAAPMLFLVLLAAACSSPPIASKRIAAFSTATQTATSNVADSFEAVEQSYFRAQLATAIANFDPAVGFDPNSIKRFLSPADIEARTKVLKSLSSYARALAAATSDSRLKEFDGATKELGDSLTKFSASDGAQALSKGALPTAAPAALATAVNAIGRWLIEYKREKALKAVIPEMNEHVAAICTLLRQDIGELEAPGMRNQLYNQFEQEITTRNQWISQNYGELDPIERRQELTRLARLPIEQEQADAALAAVRRTLVQLEKTHAKLAQAFDENDVAIDAMIRGLAAEAKRVKGFYESIAD